MLAIISLIASPVGKFLGTIGVIVGLCLLLVFAVKKYDSMIVEREKLTEETIIQKKSIDSLQALLEDTKLRLQRVAEVKGKIANAPTTIACAQSPAINIALDSLRKKSPNNGGSK